MAYALEFNPSLLSFPSEEGVRTMDLTDAIPWLEPFTDGPVTTGLDILNKGSAWVLYAISCISPSGTHYQFFPMHQILGPKQHIKSKVERLVTNKDPSLKSRRDVICVETIHLAQDPKDDVPASERWRLMQKGGAHISSSFIPVSLLPQLRAEDIPMGSELEITTSHHIQFEDAPMKLDVWTQFEPMSQDHDDGFWRLLYPPPSYSRSALIHQCVVKYGLEMDIEPAKVAVKLLRDTHDNAFHTDEIGPRSLIQRAKAEYALWPTLNHPNVAPLIGYCFYPRVFFVTPFYTNGTIIEFVKSSRAQSDMKLDLMRDVGDGLKYLHEKGVIHGDLKQDNIMVDHNSRAVIIDFGLTMTIHEASEIQNKAGVDRYLSTEVASAGTKSLQTDLYAFGFLLLEISVGTTANKHPQTTLPKPFYYPTLPPSCPLWSLMDACWARGDGNTALSISDCVAELQKMSPQDIALTS